jgi:hypothetical protein
MTNRELMDAIEQVLPNYTAALKIIDTHVICLDEYGQLTPEYILWLTYLEYRVLMDVVGEFDIIFAHKFSGLHP